MPKPCTKCAKLRTEIAELKRRLKLAEAGEKHWRDAFREIDEIVLRKAD